MQRFLEPQSCVNHSLYSVLKDDNCLSMERKLSMQKKLVTNWAFAWKLEDFGDWEWSKIDSVWKSWGEKESERSNRFADSVMRCRFEKRRPVSCCCNHFTPSESLLDLGEIVLGSRITPLHRFLHVLWSLHESQHFVSSPHVWQHAYTSQ